MKLMMIDVEFKFYLLVMTLGMLMFRSYEFEVIFSEKCKWYFGVCKCF